MVSLVQLFRTTWAVISYSAPQQLQARNAPWDTHLTRPLYSTIRPCGVLVGLTRAWENKGWSAILVHGAV
ncbi:hypothetical protein RSAG8_08037, partial [Rhizoctonia solani AG-8 WAC10335]